MVSFEVKNETLGIHSFVKESIRRSFYLTVNNSSNTKFPRGSSFYDLKSSLMDHTSKKKKKKSN